jgi:DNA-directed RNA polymerase subunit RPC12/RpoP
MCRYGLSGPYKEHYACFTCRKAFKRRLLEDVDPDGSDRPARCPQCGGPMANMGLDFAPPPMRDRRAWGVLSELWMVG